IREAPPGSFAYDPRRPEGGALDHARTKADRALSESAKGPAEDAPRKVDFFVYPDREEGAYGRDDITAARGQKLRPGFWDTGDVRQVLIGSDANGRWADVTSCGRRREGGELAGSVSIEVPRALVADGLAVYRLRVVWADGGSDDAARVRIALTGTAPE